LAGSPASWAACSPAPSTSLLLTRLLDARFVFSLWPNLAAIVASALIALAAGWLASFRILSQKPLEILRNE
jgi:putative ABC transport system permease protein